MDEVIGRDRATDKPRVGLNDINSALKDGYKGVWGCPEHVRAKSLHPKIGGE